VPKRRGAPLPAAVQNGGLPNAAPDGALIYLRMRFYKDVAPTALEAMLPALTESSGGVFCCRIILDGNSQNCFPKTMPIKAGAKSTVHGVVRIPAWLLRITVVGMMLFGSVPSFFAQPLTQVFQNSRDGFSIKFPEGWIQFPAEKLDSLNRAAEIQHPDWKHPILHYGYQMTNSAGLTFPPYVLIRVNYLDQTPEPNAVAAELIKDDLPQGVERDSPVFNATSNIVSIHFRVDSMAGSPPVDGWVAYFLTQESVIKMFFYTAQADHERLADTIQEIINNVRISKRSMFVRFTHSSHPELVQGLLGIVIVIFVLKWSKRSKTQ
jgi:hypothetical protein